MLNLLDQNEAASINICKQLIDKPILFNEIAYIASNYGFICDSITKLETKGLSLLSAIDTVDTAKEKINAVPGKAAQKIKQKIENVLAKNPGLGELNKVCQILKRECDVIISTDTSNIQFLKYAPIVSVDTERSFSVFKNVLTDNRSNLLSNI